MSRETAEDPRRWLRIRGSDVVIIRGVIARAARMYQMKVCYFVAMSNTCTLLLIPEDAQQLALFMGFVDGNIAKEAGRLHEWKQCFWERRYKPSRLEPSVVATAATRLWVHLERNPDGTLSR